MPIPPLTDAQVAQLPEDTFSTETTYVTTAAVADSGHDLTSETFQVAGSPILLERWVRKHRRRGFVPLATISGSRPVQVEHSDERHGKRTVYLYSAPDPRNPTYVAVGQITSISPANDVYIDPDTVEALRG